MAFLKRLAEMAKALNPKVDTTAVARTVDSAELRTGLTLLDGSLLQAGVIHSSGYKLVGTDHLGNKYYQRDPGSTLMNRDRVVIYGPRAMQSYGDYDPSMVAPEWHAWLHHMTDDLPSQWPKPFFHVDKQGYDPLTPYRPKGHLMNGDKRLSWKKVQAWAPPGRQ